MLEIAQFRLALDERSMEEFNEVLARFSEETEIEFNKYFPDHPSDLFRASQLWLVLVGSGVKPELSAGVPAEVEAWLEERIAGFFRSL